MAGLLSFCMLVSLKTAAVVCAIFLSRAAWRIVHMVFIYPLSDPLRLLPGPDATRFQNHFRQLMECVVFFSISETPVDSIFSSPKYSIDTHDNWEAMYGKTFRFHGFGKVRCVPHNGLTGAQCRCSTIIVYSRLIFALYLTFSIHPCMRSHGRQGHSWPGSLDEVCVVLVPLLACRPSLSGIFSMEGEEHRKQRRLLGPAFSSQTVKRVAPIFFQKANELCECWRSTIRAARNKDRSTCPETPTSIDIVHWVSRAAFDVIGLAGFDYHFHALKDESEEVYLAYRRMFSMTDKGPGFRGLLELYFPILRHIFVSSCRVKRLTVLLSSPA